MIIDLIFWLDILLTFHTGYDKGFTVVMEKGAIILNYLKGKTRLGIHWEPLHAVITCLGVPESAG